MRGRSTAKTQENTVQLCKRARKQSKCRYQINAASLVLKEVMAWCKTAGQPGKQALGALLGLRTYFWDSKGLSVWQKLEASAQQKLIQILIWSWCWSSWWASRTHEAVHGLDMAWHVGPTAKHSSRGWRRKAEETGNRHSHTKEDVWADRATFWRIWKVHQNGALDWVLGLLVIA